MVSLPSIKIGNWHVVVDLFQTFFSLNSFLSYYTQFSLIILSSCCLEINMHNTTYILFSSHESCQFELHQEMADLTWTKHMPLPSRWRPIGELTWREIWHARDSHMFVSKVENIKGAKSLTLHDQNGRFNMHWTYAFPVTIETHWWVNTTRNLAVMQCTHIYICSCL